VRDANMNGYPEQKNTWNAQIVNQESGGKNERKDI
jgi:hypothetical protein